MVDKTFWMNISYIIFAYYVDLLSLEMNTREKFQKLKKSNQNLSSVFVEWNFVLVIATRSRHHRGVSFGLF